MPVMKLLLAVICLTALLTSSAFAQSGLTPTQKKIKAALAMDHRSDENRARDKNRDPVRAMDFCRLADDMTVIEFGPGGGWYSEILGPVLEERGKLFLASKEEWMYRLDDLLFEGFMSAVEKHPIDISYNKETRLFAPGDIVFSMTNADMALNIREYHLLDPDGAAELNGALFDALKPGGYYCIIDHTRRHMETSNAENRRRIDPVRVIHEVQAAGFAFVDYTDMFFKADDELRYEVGRRTVKGNTDRFTLLFQKPPE